MKRRSRRVGRPNRQSKKNTKMLVRRYNALTELQRRALTKGNLALSNKIDKKIHEAWIALGSP